MIGFGFVKGLLAGGGLEESLPALDGNPLISAAVDNDERHRALGEKGGWRDRGGRCSGEKSIRPEGEAGRGSRKVVGMLGDVSEEGVKRIERGVEEEAAESGMTDKGRNDGGGSHREAVTDDAVPVDLVAALGRFHGNGHIECLVQSKGCARRAASSVVSEIDEERVGSGPMNHARQREEGGLVGAETVDHYDESRSGVSRNQPGLDGDSVDGNELERFEGQLKIARRSRGGRGNGMHIDPEDPDRKEDSKNE